MSKVERRWASLLVGVPVINFKSSEPSRLSWCSLEAEEAEKCCSFGETEFGGGVGDIGLRELTRLGGRVGLTL